MCDGIGYRYFERSLLATARAFEEVDSKINITRPIFGTIIFCGEWK